MDVSKQEPKQTHIDKTIAGLHFLLHVPCIFASFQFTWGAFWVALLLYIITGLSGITISYHRDLLHRSFKLPKGLEYLFAYYGVQALQGDPIDWVSKHRCHHQFVDTNKDLHSPIQGFWWVSLLSFGDGWHNNHHAFEYSARHGLEWWQIDFSWYVIMFLEAIGVATEVNYPLKPTSKD